MTTLFSLLSLSVLYHLYDSLYHDKYKDVQTFCVFEKKYRLYDFTYTSVSVCFGIY